MTSYEAVIGLEIYAELIANSTLFAAGGGDLCVGDDYQIE
jgi:hypothetical protein